jgi:hypothetical protein
VNKSSVKVNEGNSSTYNRKPTARKRLKMTAAALFLVGGSIIVASATSAHAAVVPNMMLCEPDTGWCYQTNPPVNHSVPHECQWDYRLHNLHSGMWYTGCDIWGPSIH